MENENKKTMINIRIETDIINEYKKHCEDKGYSLSKRIRTLIKKDLENGLCI